MTTQHIKNFLFDVNDGETGEYLFKSNCVYAWNGEYNGIDFRDLVLIKVNNILKSDDKYKDINIKKVKLTMTGVRAAPEGE